MKKTHFIYLAGTIVLAGSIFASCVGKNQSKSLETEATEEAFTPGDKETALDSLKAIDEMVEAVETPIKGINNTKYNTSFFLNPANKADKATADAYAETPTGLKYVMVTEGRGKSPKATDAVTVHYVGTLTDGTQFDSSIDRGEPATFPLNRVIPGWTEGLQYMKEGGVAVFYLPSEIAYGEQGSFNPYTGQYTIPPSAPLLFWVQLINVE